MKKLEKLSLNSDKVLTNDDLKNLKGGECYTCNVIYYSGLQSTGYACDCGTTFMCEQSIYDAGGQGIWSVACE